MNTGKNIFMPRVMAFEEEFDFEIPDEEAERMRKVKDVVEFISRRLPKK